MGRGVGRFLSTWKGSKEFIGQEHVLAVIVMDHIPIMIAAITTTTTQACIFPK